jgi:hypothetical protein
MSGSGRMGLRLASSYREDDRRRAAEWRGQQATTTAAPKPAAVSVLPARSAVRGTIASIRRLGSRFA